MTEAALGDLMYTMFGVSMKLAGPILIISMAIGVLISIIQAATQIHEQTITFVPKLIVIGLLLLVFGSNMMETLKEFTINIFQIMLV